MTIDSRTLNQNTGKENTKACNNFILGGGEPINWAYITKSGQSQAPANPLFTGTFSNPNFAAVNPNNDKDLFMNPGDRVRIHMHDTSAGLRIDLNDLTSGQNGSMTASIANGFAHILYAPHSRTCQAAPFAFHPEYSTANPRGNTWSAHTYNVAMSDEIGHFENCLQIDAAFNCVVPGAQDAGGLDPDDDNNFCVPGTDSTLVKIDGCFSGDADWDAQSYRAGLARHRPQPGPRPGTASHTGHVHQPAGEREHELLDRRVRNRPTTHRGEGLAGQPAVLQPGHGRKLREPAQRGRVLPTLHHRQRQRHVRVAARRPVHPRHDKHLRGEPHHRVRPAARHRLPDQALQGGHPVQQLQQREHRKPVPAMTT
jgi:hypothetical protein